MGIEVARAIATFQLPDASGVDWTLLAKLRMDDQRFSEFRANSDLVDRI
jgi:inorganic pyrophosphatase